MTTIKVVFVFSFVLITAAVFAQPQGRNSNRERQGPPPVPTSEQLERMVDQLAEEISLSENQKKKILDLHIEHFNTVKEKTSDSKRPERKEMEKLRSDFEESVKALLTEDQIVKFEKFMMELRGRHPGKKS
jgi:hypothetical protein